MKIGAKTQYNKIRADGAKTTIGKKVAFLVRFVTYLWEKNVIAPPRNLHSLKIKVPEEDPHLDG